MRPAPPPTVPTVGFDISVLAAGEYVWVSAQSSQGAVFAVPRHPPVWRLDGFDGPGDWLNATIRVAATGAVDAAVGIGRELSTLVFGVPEIADLFGRTRGVARCTDAPLLVRLKTAPESVGGWPWELLVDPESLDGDPAQSVFLTGSIQTHIVRTGRFRDYGDHRATRPLPARLNVLIVMSSPVSSGTAAVSSGGTAEAPFDLYAEKRSLLGELRPLIEDGLLNVVVEDRPSLARIRERVCAQAGGFQILHYLGHAAPDGFKLEDSTGQGRFESNAEVGAVLAELPDLRLAVFAGCETARTPVAATRADGAPADLVDTWRGALSTADLFVRDVCPMVIGMQTVLPFGTERIFTRNFYKTLTSGGKTVADAVRAARKAIQNDETVGGGQLNWAVPTLYLGGTDAGALIDRSQRVRPTPIPQPVRVQLGIRQGELRFISRLAELRVAIDVLSGIHEDKRFLHVHGVSGAGKTAFLDRVLDELDSGIVRVIVSASGLLDEAEQKRKDRNPLGILGGEIDSAVRQAKRLPARVDVDKNPDLLWQQALQAMGTMPLALVVDEADLLFADERARTVAKELIDMVDQRLVARLALASAGPLPGLTDDPRKSRYLSSIQLDLLSWPEVWRWVRRNLPELARFGESVLSPFYRTLTHLEQWDDLANAVRAGQLDRQALATEAHRLAGVGAAATTEEAATTDVYDARSADAGPAPAALRIEVPRRFAAAGTDVAAVIGEFAARHGVAGRVITECAGIPGPALAVVAPAAEGEDDIVVASDGDRLVITAHASVAAGLPGERCDGEGRRLVVGADLSAAPLQSSTILPVAVAALLVWATDRTLAPGQVRAVLLDTATPASPGCPRLDLAAAMTAERRALLVAALDAKPLQIGQLLAATTVRPEFALPLIDAMVDDRTLHRDPDGTYSLRALPP